MGGASGADSSAAALGDALRRISELEAEQAQAQEQAQSSAPTLSFSFFFSTAK